MSTILEKKNKFLTGLLSNMYICVSLGLLVLVCDYLISDIYNGFISFYSFVFVVLSLISIYHAKIKSYNLFSLVYFSALFTSTLKLSIYQTNKSELDAYYFFVGPVLFVTILFIFDHLPKVRFKNPVKLFQIENVYLFLLVLYISIKVYIGFSVGWRIESILYDTFLGQGNEFTIPGLSGIAAISQWLLLIFTPYVRRRYVVIAIISIIILSGILHVKRGDIMRVFSFLMIYFVYKQSYFEGFSKRKIGKFILFVSLIIFSFVALGNLREDARGSDSSEFSNNIGIKDSSSAIAWFYGYVSINFEVVRLYFNRIPTNYPTSLVNTIFGEQVSDNTFSPSINGFNASTFISSFIVDYQVFYFVEMILFALILGLLIYFVRCFNLYGTYIFILSILSFCFFGNYFESRSIFLAIIFSMLLFPFLKLRKVV